MDYIIDDSADINIATVKVTELVTEGAEMIGHCNKWDQLAQEASVLCKMIQIWGT